MASKRNVLFLGATGYIGGSVLWNLLQHPNISDMKITVLVRNADKAEKLRGFDVVPFVGDLADSKLLQELANDADVVFSFADSDNVQATKATLAGAKKRFERTGQATTYIHTVSAGIIADCTVEGMHKDSPEYDDLDVAALAAIAPTQLHRAVDLELLAADDEGYIKIHIVVPTTVFGVPAGPFAERGIQRLQNTILPWLIKPSLARGQGGMVGDGKNVWHNVHVHDLADLCILMYDGAIRADPHTAAGHGRERFYFAENGAHELVELCTVIARVLFEQGRGKSPVPVPFTAEEKKPFGPMAALIGSNAKCRASRARALGWQPKKTTRDMLVVAEQVTADYVLTGKAA
ncbi:hypothetical protein GGX14DRAFT_427394 [Mycena pura]|uniref:NmrA-like domain-containing protein n=1 Tax=Mycena pura TaxID=153505 RepID=A0AAD6YLZ3_9AGAR|nr:hypothetical protein GGX14DRAFT_427394 [Mycena pura]